MRVLQAAEVGSWVKDVLLSPERKRPVVAVTTRPYTGDTWVEPQELAAAVGAIAEVVCLETGDPTWALAEALPNRLDCYGGALRIWWPGLHLHSEPYDHKLYFVHSSADAERVFEQVVSAIQSFAQSESADHLPVVEAKVAAIEGARIELSAEGFRGVLRYADLPMAALAQGLEVGLTIRARPVRQLSDSTWEFSVQGLLPPPWDRVLSELEVGDVVMGRVQNVKEYGAFVEILPGVSGLVHISEVDWSFVGDVKEFVMVGQTVPVKLVALNREGRRMELSIKHALGTDPRPLPSLLPEGPGFRWPAEAPQPAPEIEPNELQERVQSLTDELEAATQDRARLAEQNRTIKVQASELRKEVRSLEDKFQALERRAAPQTDPLSSQRAFLLGVRLAYSRMFDEDDRLRHPLCRMRVGSAFLDSLRALAGVEVQKVLEICAQVASGSAHEVSAREVHQLRDGSRGAPAHVRSSDGAQAWRCALQVNTPSARRLHWWKVPGEGGGTIELASVGVHDDYSIPE